MLFMPCGDPEFHESPAVLLMPGGDPEFQESPAELFIPCGGPEFQDESTPPELIMFPLAPAFQEVSEPEFQEELMPAFQDESMLGDPADPEFMLPLKEELIPVAFAPIPASIPPSNPGGDCKPGGPPINEEFEPMFIPPSNEEFVAMLLLPPI